MPSRLRSVRQHGGMSASMTHLKQQCIAKMRRADAPHARAVVGVGLGDEDGVGVGAGAQLLHDAGAHFCVPPLVPPQLVRQGAELAVAVAADTLLAQAVQRQALSQARVVGARVVRRRRHD